MNVSYGVLKVNVSVCIALENAVLLSVREDLSKQVNRIFDSGTSNTIQVSAPLDEKYLYKNDTTKILCTKALFLYSNASLASAQSGTQVDMHIVEYIGVSS